MSGPVRMERLTLFAMSRAFFQAWRTRPNVIRANCKICGVDLQKGQGTPVTVAGDQAGSANLRFLCRPCLKPIEKMWKQAIAAGFIEPKTDRQGPEDP